MTADAERLRRVRELFDLVVDLEPAERRARLEAAAPGDAALQAEVLELVGESERTAPGFASRLSPADDATRDDASRLVGQRLGAYDVVRLIGLGGMGAVYEGVRADEQYDKRVALKLVQGDRRSQPTLARFRRERRILASLQHRNIATLLDAGVSPDGRPFLVMEYVEGEPITTWCDRRSLPVADRLRLFRQVCEAVRHAHRNLVIHRDIKPGNILVTPEGDVKLLDFGVAKILGDDSESAEMPLTRGGARLFTPEYASPEQIRGDALTTASDIFSMGVVLYELLAGRRPHATRGSAAMVERAVLEEPIARPSAAATGDAARLRGERNAESLRRRLAGELDSITMLALRSEPELRWRSAEALADDLHRHLEGRPVEAQRGWRGYRVRKFVVRNRVVLLAATLVVAALVGGVIATGREAGRARRAQARAERVSTFLTDILQSVRPSMQGRDVPVSELLDAAATRVQTEMASEPDVQAELEMVIGQSDLALGRGPEAERHLRAAVALQERLAGPRSEAVASALSDLAAVYFARRDLAPMDSVVRRALAIARAVRPPPDALLATLLGQLGTELHNRGENAGAESAHREALAIRRRLFGDRSDLVCLSMANLSVVLGEEGRWAAAESLNRNALGIAQINHPGLTTEVTDAENALATMLDLQGKFGEAESLYADVLARREKLLGRDHPDYALTLMNYAGFVFDRGRYAQAADLSRQLLALRGKSLPESHPAISSSLQTLGRCLDQLGRHDEAERALTESLDLRARYIGPDTWPTVNARSLLGDHFRQTRQYARAERLLLDADAALSRLIGPDNPRTRLNLGRLVKLYEETHRAELAAKYRSRLPAASS